MEGRAKGLAAAVACFFWVLLVGVEPLRLLPPLPFATGAGLSAVIATFL